MRTSRPRVLQARRMHQGEQDVSNGKILHGHQAVIRKKVLNEANGLKPITIKKSRETPSMCISPHACCALSRTSRHSTLAWEPLSFYVGATAHHTAFSRALALSLSGARSLSRARSPASTHDILRVSFLSFFPKGAQFLDTTHLLRKNLRPLQAKAMDLLPRLMM